MRGCRICGNQTDHGEQFTEWVKPTFTDHDLLIPGDIICNDCLFWFDEKSEKLAQLVGKDKPQRMRNYSHFIINDKWIPLSKGDKIKMKELLLGNPFPELAAIAESGQKHIVFRATRNPINGKAGWVQFEEQQLWLNPNELQELLNLIEPAINIFAKSEIESGKYSPRRILDYGLEVWQQLENTIRPKRGSLLLNLALFLAQKLEDDNEGNGSGSTGNRVAGHRQRVQEQVPPDDLAAIREHGESERLHQQSGQVRQLAMFENASENSIKHDPAS